MIFMLGSVGQEAGEPQGEGRPHFTAELGIRDPQLRPAKDFLNKTNLQPFDGICLSIYE